MRLLDKWINKKVTHFLDEWVIKNTERIDDLKGITDSAENSLLKLQKQLEEIETLTLRVPIEDYVFNTATFQRALHEVFNYASQIWNLSPQNIKAFLPETHGEVSRHKPFEMLADDGEFILIAGLRTERRSKSTKTALYRLTVADRWGKPFPVHKETKQVIFLAYYLVRPDCYFRIEQMEGPGVLRFSIIGAKISRWNGLGLSFENLSKALSSRIDLS